VDTPTITPTQVAFPKVKVRLKTDSRLAWLAARKLAYGRVAMVIGRTIYLHNASEQDFLSSRRWMIHELKHVEQFREHGLVRFLVLYLREYLKNGYYDNKYEIEARDAERDGSLLERYEITTNRY
jgi:hypothetical protein